MTVELDPLPRRRDVSEGVVRREREALIQRMMATATVGADGQRTRETGSTDRIGHPETRGVPQGLKIGRYLRKEQLGCGGMGTVWEAYDPDLRRTTAIKLLRTDSNHGQSAGRMLREAQAMARLSHPNVVQIYDVGIHEGQIYLAMEFVEGCNLDEWMQSRPRAPREVISVFRAAGRGLLAAHMQGIVHRDFKPQNVLMSRDGRVLVTDFGLARSVDTDAAQGLNRSSHDATSLSTTLEQDVTSAGTLLGTPAYMAPEQRIGDESDERSDQYSFCVALHEGLFGHRPERRTDGGALATIRAKRGVSSAVAKILQRGLSFSPEERFPSMQDLLLALDRGLLAPRRRALGATILAGGMTFGYMVVAEEPCDGFEDKVEAIWTLERQDSLKASFSQTHTTLGLPAWTYLTKVIDRHRADWMKAKERTCIAEREGLLTRAEADRRAACLDRTLDQSDRLLVMLEDSDEDRLQAFYGQPNPLPSFLDCTNDDRLSEEPDPNSNAALREVEDALEKSWSLSQMGDYDSALEAARRAETTARSGHAIETLPRVLLANGEILYEEKQWPLARAAVQEAFVQAVAGNQDSQAGRALARYIQMAAHADEDLQSLQAWLPVAEAWSRRLREHDPLLVADFENALGRANFRTGDHRTSVKQHLAAKKHYDEWFGGSNISSIEALRYAADAELMAGNSAAALELLELAREDASTLLGPRHPINGDIAYDMAVALLDVGELDRGEDSAREALELFEAHQGTRSEQVGWGNIVLARALLLKGEVAEGEVAARRAVETADKDDMRWPEMMSAQAYAARMKGELGDALHLYQSALTEARKRFPPEHTYLGEMNSRVGLILVGLGRVSEAESHFVEARRIFKQALIPKRSVVWADMFQGLGEIELARDDAAQAARNLEQALKIRSASRGNKWELANVTWPLAQALIRTDPARAQTLALESRRAYASWSWEYAQPKLQEIDRWMIPPLPSNFLHCESEPSRCQVK